jgi:D-beta-D-heptose 7-phosphate kinase / D-beta-D-heptose 1-phosphate adenosyltransferase
MNLRSTLVRTMNDCIMVNEMPLVFTNGCFDIIHRGHIELLKFCSELGELVVGLNSDLSVRKLKGKHRPINPEQDRKLLLESITYVSRVVLFSEMDPRRIIEEIRPDIIVKGGDYSVNQVVGNDLAEVRIFPYIEGKSTSRIVSQLQSLDGGNE